MKSERSSQVASSAGLFCHALTLDELPLHFYLLFDYLMSKRLKNVEFVEKHGKQDVYGLVLVVEA